MPTVIDDISPTDYGVKGQGKRSRGFSQQLDLSKIQTHPSKTLLPTPGITQMPVFNLTLNYFFFKDLYIFFLYNDGSFTHGCGLSMFV